MSDPRHLLLWPVLAQIGLTFGLYVWLSVVRQLAVQRGEVSYGCFELGREEPVRIARITRNLANQFELPVIVFASVALLAAFDRVTLVDVWAGWIFVAGRVAHTLVQTLTDNVPLRGQVFLTIALLFWMGRVRFAEVGAGTVKVGDIALGQKTWPVRAQQAANAYANQFELPALFYALAPLALYTRKADLLFVVLAWVFVATRIVHAGVYVTTNHVPYRFRAFAAGALVLGVMWIVFAFRILVAPVLV